MLLLGAERAVAAAGQQKPALVLTDPPRLELHLVPIDHHAVALGGCMGNGHAVRLTAQTQLVAAPQRGARLWAPAPGVRVEARAIGGEVFIRELDRGLHERNVTMAHWSRLAAQVQPVEPGGVDVAGAHLGTVEEFEQEPLIRGAAVDHYERVRQATAQARERLVAVAAPGDHLADHRVELGRDQVTLSNTGIDPQPGPGRQPEHGQTPRRGREPELRILSVELGLDRVPGRRRGLAYERAAGRDVKLELDQVKTGHGLGHRMLDL